MTYKQIKDKHQKAYGDIMDKAGLFWAFGNDQFEEGLDKLKESKQLLKGEKLTRFPGGGFVPSKNFDNMLKEMKQADKLEKKELKEARELKTSAILYELKNHECFYTGNIDEVIDIFKGIYTPKAIQKVYKDNYADFEF